MGIMVTSTSLAVLITLSAVSTVAPGVKLVRTGGSAMAVVSLCSAGISVRATTYAERKATAPTWGARIGARVAINADFFDLGAWTKVYGRARGAGQDWPAGRHALERRPYWQFGPNLAELVTNGAQAPGSTAAVRDIVGGHNLIISQGKTRGPAFDGDAVLVTAHRRTGIGLSKDERTLFLYATDKSLTGTGMVADMFALAREAGVAIDVATNMDGGGSSQMYVAGVGAVISSSRLVNNHLGVIARGSGAAPQCNNVPPRGAFDTANCAGLTGWAQDTNTPDAASQVHLYYGGAAGAAGAVGRSVTANVRRVDLCGPLGGSCNHGFVAPAPASWFDGKPHPVSMYALDTEKGATKAFPAKNFVCAPPALAGVKRHITSQASFAAWGLTAFWHVRPVTDAQLAAVGDERAWPAAPVLWRAGADPRVWLIDSGFKRHVPSQVIAAAWGLDLSKVLVKTQAELDALPVGPPLPAGRTVVKGAGAAIYAMDVAFPSADGGLTTDAGTFDPDAGEDFPVVTEDGGLPEEPGDLDGGEELPPIAEEETDAGVGEEVPPAMVDPNEEQPMTGGCVAAPSGVVLLGAVVVALRRRRRS